MYWDAVSKAIDEAEKHFPTMDIQTKPGTEVIFKYPDNGYEYDQELSARELLYKAKYTVKEIDIGQSVSYVELIEKPGIKFNTVHFANIEEEI